MLSPAVAVMFEDLGLSDLIVGKHDYDLVLPEGVPAVGHQEAIDYEALLAAAPTDIIIEWGTRPLPPTLTAMADRHGWNIRRVRLLTIDDIARTTDDLAVAYGAVSFDPTPKRRPVGVPEDLGSLADAVRFEDPGDRLSMDMPSAALARAWSVRGEGFATVGPVLLLGSTTPPGALGPGSFHHQILERIGGVPALGDGSPWMELDAEDILRLDPAAIVLISPRAPGSAESSAAGPVSVSALLDRLGRIGTLDIEAVRTGRVALIDSPMALLPSTRMGAFADELASILDAWASPSAP